MVDLLPCTLVLYWPSATGPPVIFPNSCLAGQLPGQLSIIFLKSCSRASSRASYLISFRILGASSRSGQLLKASRVPVVYLYCVRRNNTIMAMKGALLFRPTQLKLDGILTCTGVVCTSAARRICEFLHVEIFALALLA